jgi:hypothetical protein
MSKRFVAAPTLTSTAATALASGDDDLWVSPVAIVCVEQNPSYGATWYGHLLVDEPLYQEWRKTEGASLVACVAKNKEDHRAPMVSDELCAQLFKQSPTSTPIDLNARHDKYATSIQGLSQQFEDCGQP